MGSIVIEVFQFVYFVVVELDFLVEVDVTVEVVPLIYVQLHFLTWLQIVPWQPTKTINHCQQHHNHALHDLNHQ